MDIGDRLRHLIHNSGLTQEQIAERAGLSKGYISALVHGQQNPTLTTLIKLAQAFDMRLWEFVFPLDDDESEVIADPLPFDAGGE